MRDRESKEVEREKSAGDAHDTQAFLWFYFGHWLNSSSHSKPLRSHKLPELSYN